MTRGLRFIERLDPRTKFVVLLILAIQVFLFGSTASLFAAPAVIAIATASARIPLHTLGKRLLSVSVFLILILGLNLFGVSGDVMFEFAGLYATREGLHQGILLSSRILLLLVAATVFVQTTPVAAMIDGIESVFQPVRKHLGPIVQVLTIALNFVPLMIQSAQQIKKAQIARGAEPDRNLVRQLHFAVSATVPLLVMTMRSSEHLALAMEARCFLPRSERSRFVEPRLLPGDWTTLGIVLAQFILSTVAGA